MYGINIRKEGAEQSSGLVDDLQKLMNVKLLTMIDKQIYYKADKLPDDYLHYVRTDVFAQQTCCPERRMTVYEVEEANISIILDDKNKQPNFEWAETVATRIDNSLRVYTNGEFQISKCYLVYYRKPIEVQFIDCIDIKTGFPFTAEQECEFNDDVAEVIADNAAMILAGDIESITQYQRQQQNVQSNS
jgi:hypothetical protein